MPEKYIRAIRMALHILEILRDHSKFSDVMAISSMLLSPNVYEAQADCPDFTIAPHLVKKANVALDRDLRNPKVIIPQVELLIKVHTTVLKPNGSVALIDIMEEQSGSRILPSCIHRLYFNALMQEKHYDKFFIHSTQLSQQYEGYPFARVLLQLMEEVALPLLLRFFSQDCMKAAQSSSDPTCLIAGALTAINIIQNCTILPDFIKDKVPGWISKFSSELDQMFRRMSHEEAVENVNIIMEQMVQIRDAKRTSTAFGKDELGAFGAMLKKHAGRVTSNHQYRSTYDLGTS